MADTCYCNNLTSRKQLLSQEREFQSKLSSSGHTQFSPFLSSPVVISSQDSASTNSSPLPIYPSFIPSPHGNRSFPNSDLHSSTNTGQSWKGNCVLHVPQSDKTLPSPLDQESENGHLGSTCELNDDILPQDEEYMYIEEDLESYSIPDNFDDFPEDPPLQQAAPFSRFTSAVDPPKSTYQQNTTRAPTISTSTALQPAVAGNRGVLPMTTTNSRSFQAVKPASGGSDAKDDSSEFHGQYSHTKEMYKVFNQVCNSVYHGLGFVCSLIVETYRGTYM